MRLRESDREKETQSLCRVARLESSALLQNPISNPTIYSRPSRLVEFRRTRQRSKREEHHTTYCANRRPTQGTSSRLIDIRRFASYSVSALRFYFPRNPMDRSPLSLLFRHTSSPRVKSIRQANLTFGFSARTFPPTAEFTSFVSTQILGLAVRQSDSSPQKSSPFKRPPLPLFNLGTSIQPLTELAAVGLGREGRRAGKQRSSTLNGVIHARVSST